MNQLLLYAFGGVYGAASLACFTMYALDKSAAKAGRRRTPESSLLWVGLVGGWPGGLLAQRWLRHKSSKRSFLARFWLTVAVNVAAVGAGCYFLIAA